MVFIQQKKKKKKFNTMVLKQQVTRIELGRSFKVQFVQAKNHDRFLVKHYDADKFNNKT